MLIETEREMDPTHDDDDDPRIKSFEDNLTFGPPNAECLCSLWNSPAHLHKLHHCTDPSHNVVLVRALAPDYKGEYMGENKGENRGVSSGVVDD
jgi:hypothetical protein